MNKKSLRLANSIAVVFVILMAGLLILTGCSSDDEDDTNDDAVAQETEEATSDIDDPAGDETDPQGSTPDANGPSDPQAPILATEDVTPEPTEETGPTPTQASPVATEASTPDVNDGATPEVTEEPITFRTEGGEYYIAVQYTLDQDSLAENAPAPPAGSRWVIVVATLANQAGEAVEVEAEQLALIDSEGDRVSPEPPNEFTTPPLVGTTLNEGESISGMALFAVPEDRSLDYLEWCLDEQCQQTLQAPIP